LTIYLTSLHERKVNCWGEEETSFHNEAGFVCDNAFV